MECKYCNNTDYKGFYIEDRGNQKALMCGCCGRWQKWVGKKEIRYLLSQGINEYNSSDKVVERENLSKIDIKNEQENGLKCSYCGGKNFEKKQISIHIGLYCKNCGKWIKWIKRR